MHPPNSTPLAVFTGDIYFCILFSASLLAGVSKLSIWPKKQTYFGTPGSRSLHSMQTVENLNKWTVIYLVLSTCYAQVWLMHCQCPFPFSDKCFMHNAGSAASTSVHFCGFNFVPLFGLSKVFRLKQWASLGVWVPKLQNRKSSVFYNMFYHNISTPKANEFMLECFVNFFKSTQVALRARISFKILV